ncbi:hypothetical protein RD792_017791 [Penstemon davidsonii]|uniref:Uncharacterized protein n=1 Tax=Penstemon davidsonii TaxID=160366 RepID=A0ABR0DVX4_9LAMI|nr:hypothetical protein RD792_017791 [Penstemon davidsonii]
MSIVSCRGRWHQNIPYVLDEDEDLEVKGGFDDFQKSSAKTGGFSADSNPISSVWVQLSVHQTSDFDQQSGSDQKLLQRKYSRVYSVQSQVAVSETRTSTRGFGHLSISQRADFQTSSINSSVQELEKRDNTSESIFSKQNSSKSQTQE